MELKIEAWCVGKGIFFRWDAGYEYNGDTGI